MKVAVKNEKEVVMYNEKVMTEDEALVAAQNGDNTKIAVMPKEVFDSLLKHGPKAVQRIDLEFGDGIGLRSLLYDGNAMSDESVVTVSQFGLVYGLCDDESRTAFADGILCIPTDTAEVLCKTGTKSNYEIYADSEQSKALSETRTLEDFLSLISDESQKEIWGDELILRWKEGTNAVFKISSDKKAPSCMSKDTGDTIPNISGITDFCSNEKLMNVFDGLLEEACRQWCCFIDDTPERKDGEGFADFFYEICNQKATEFIEDCSTQATVSLSTCIDYLKTIPKDGGLYSDFVMLVCFVFNRSENEINRAVKGDKYWII